MEIQIMHTLDGHFACWTATTHTDKHGAVSSQPICTTSARSPEALLPESATQRYNSVKTHCCNTFLRRCYNVVTPVSGSVTTLY